MQIVYLRAKELQSEAEKFLQFHSIYTISNSPHLHANLLYSDPALLTQSEGAEFLCQAVQSCVAVFAKPHTAGQDQTGLDPPLECCNCFHIHNPKKEEIDADR